MVADDAQKRVDLAKIPPKIQSDFGSCQNNQKPRGKFSHHFGGNIGNCSFEK